MKHPITLSLSVLLLAFSALALAAEDAPAPYAGLAYNGKAISLPGAVEAEEYDIAPDAKSGTTFGYGRDGDKNGVRKTPDAIGMARKGNGHVSTKGEAHEPNGAYLGWTQTGQWTNYLVRVSESGTYCLGGQFAAAGTDGTLSFAFTPLSKGATKISTGPLSIPTTAGFQPGVEVYHVWEKLDNLTEVMLAQGDYLLTVKIEKNAGFNLDFFTITKKP